ncbi:MAG TPA: conjugative transposon protein TraJ [Puia sp.]|jgi:conjugative transposon TraJ protein
MGINSLHAVLNQLYNSMLPQCSALISVGQAIAGFAALWYIGVRVWRSIANAAPVDEFSLLRPFCIGGVILLFPFLIGLLNGVLEPVVTGTAEMEGKASADIAALMEQKQQALDDPAGFPLSGGGVQSEDISLWEMYAQNNASGSSSGLTSGSVFSMMKNFFNFRSTLKEWLSGILEVVYEAAALCINTLRTFQLIVLAILGPLVLGLSVFDGFQPSLRNWLARYISVYLWLPVANIFGAIIANIQAAMLQLDIQQIQNYGGTYFSSTDIGYLIFLIIGIVGYFTVPSVAGYIVSTGNSEAMVSRMNRLTSKAGKVIVKGVRIAAGAGV